MLRKATQPSKQIPNIGTARTYLNTWNKSFVVDGVVDGAQSVAHGILNLGERVLVGTLHEDRDGLGHLALLDKGVLVFAQDMFVDVAGVAQMGLLQAVETVHSKSAAGQRQAFHVAPFCATQSKNAYGGQKKNDA